VSRNPSADNIALCHMYNNYLQNVTSYGNYVRGLTKARHREQHHRRVTQPP
jgi:pectate lyase